MTNSTDAAKILFLAAAVFLAGCSKKQSADETPHAAQTGTRTMRDVLSAPAPLALYKEAFGSFRFSSQSVLTLSREGQPGIYEGSTALEIDKNGNYHLVRIPLSGETPVELIYSGRKVFFKSGDENNFRVVGPLPEFERWLTVSMREVFARYEHADYGEDAPNSSKKGLKCWDEKSGTLCADPATGLPMEGNIRVELKEGTLQIRFAVADGKSRQVTIAPPQISGKEK